MHSQLYTLAMSRLTAFAFAALLLALPLAGCGGDDTTTTVSTSAPQPDPTLAVSTNDPSLDKVIVEALARDEIALAGLTGYQTEACRAAAEPGENPECREDEESGTEVEVLAGSSCSNAWVRPELVPDAFRLSLAPEEPRLVAVYTPAYPEGTFGGGFGATAVAVFDTGLKVDGTAKGVALHVLDGRVVWLQNDCADASELLAPDRVASFIIPPEGQ